ncbi:hypothetical protein Gotri_004610 [Gossypium trilobum]|uniref:Uncharacterized protein n=1 Tax=Gossypium trilobum TaxID=34281 RepID=A0A7J9F5E1_9ROSI|nr:hypothetical protein [Gossypium trilobum]
MAKDKLPYSLAFKVGSNLLEKETVQIGVAATKMMSQCFYTGEDDVALPRGKPTGHNENHMLERSLVREPTGCSTASTYVEVAYGRDKWFTIRALFSMEGESVDYFEKLEGEGEGEEWRFTGFYGLPSVSNRRDSWDVLRRGLPKVERRMDLFRDLLKDYRFRENERKTDDLKRELTSKLKMLMTEDYDDENFAGFINLKF